MRREAKADDDNRAAAIHPLSPLHNADVDYGTAYLCCHRRESDAETLMTKWLADGTLTVANRPQARKG